jgi:hypothetical protein
MLSEPGNPFAPTPPPTAPTASYVHPPQPPLSIAHLLVWTAGTAVILAVGRVYFTFTELPESFRTYFNVQQLVYSPLAGAAVSSLILLVYRRLTSGPPFPAQPGHWLLLVHGLQTAVGWIAHLVLVTLRRSYLDMPGVLVLVAVCGVGAVASGVACWRLRDRGAWRLYLLVSALLDLLVAGGWLFAFYAPYIGTGYMPFAPALQILGGLLLGLALLGLVVVELVRGVRRDWLHWVGVALSLIYPVLSLVFTVLSRFLIRS